MGLVQQLRLIASGHWTGMGREWMEKRAGEAADEIEKLKSQAEETRRLSLDLYTATTAPAVERAKQ